MQSGYGPALLLGVLIGGAILLDDVITPERKDPPPRVAMFHHGEDGLDAEALGADEDRSTILRRKVLSALPFLTHRKQAISLV